MYWFIPLTRGHPSWKATFLMQKGWPHKKGPLYNGLFNHSNNHGRVDADSQVPASSHVMAPSSGTRWLFTRCDGMISFISPAFWRPFVVLRNTPKPMSLHAVVNFHLQVIWEMYYILCILYCPFHKLQWSVSQKFVRTILALRIRRALYV